ncbi:MAG: conjugal transfer protein TraJ [Alphaproteobacteria bacterium]|nr:conjugal transfer protein TraJ [Alphaproteobacteria bacterium]
MTAQAQIKAYLTVSEKAEVTALAKQARITVSELVRRLVLGRKLPDAGRHQSVIDLVKVNADLARLGNLLRMALTDEDFQPPEGMDLETLFDMIRETQSILKGKIEEL